MSKEKKKVSYTKEQLSVIEKQGTNILVSAAAGSGKTAVLVQRILRILQEEQVPITKMLIVTFTNAAAGEMKERIQKVMVEKIIEDPDDSSFLQEQMSTMGEASISTLHSFCIELLRENFHHLNLSPSFKVATGASADVLRADAMQEVLERYYEEGSQDFIRLMDAYGGEKSDDNFVELIDRIFRFVQGQSEPWQWLEEKTQAFDMGFDDFLRSPVMEFYLEQIGDELRLVRESIEEASKVSRENDLPYYENFADDARSVELLQAKLDLYIEATGRYCKDGSGLYEDFVRALNSLSFSRLKSVSKKQKEAGLFDEELLDEMKEVRNSEIKGRIKKLQTDLVQEDLMRLYEESLELYPMMKVLYRFVKDYYEAYQIKKKEMELVDFSDLEHFALELLKKEEVRSQLRERFEYIFFDEYQDSNLVQETIVEAICRHNNLFFVGDIKQSIYGFRLAEPKLFQRRYRNYATGEGGSSVKIDLSKNFRSREEILNFCNDVFYALMTPSLGEIDYTAEGQALVPGASFLPQEDSVEFYLGEKSEEGSISHHIIARRILELQGQKRRKPGGEEEEIHFRDMVVLMRSPKGSAKDLEKVLKSYGIPCYLDYSSVGFDVIEIRSLLEYLRLIDNEMQDEALIASMLSYFGGLDEDDLVEIRSLQREGSFYNAVMSYMEGGEDRDEVLVRKIDDFFKEVERWRSRERLLALSDFVFELLTKSGYLNYQNLLEKGEERVENLRGFLQKVEEYEASENAKLFGFLQYVDRILKERGDSLEAMGLSEGADVVRIMSVHKSKGLEFPVVFLTDLNRNFYFADNREAVILHNELGLGPRYVDLEKRSYRDSFFKKMIQRKKKQELLSEEVRILYVALTRAVDRLILIGETAKPYKTISEAYRGTLKEKLFKGRSYLGWLLPILVRQRNATGLRAFADLVPEEARLIEGRSVFSFHSLSMDDLEEKEAEEREDMRTKVEDFLACEDGPSEAEKMRTLLEERLSLTYPYQEEVLLPYKKGVSRLLFEEVREKEEAKSLFSETRVQESAEERKGSSSSFEETEVLSDTPSSNGLEQTYRLPDFMQEKTGLSSAEKGSLAHFVIQNLELKPQTSDELRAKVEDMRQRELLTDEEAEAVEIEWLTSFLESPMGKRLMLADKVYREQPFMMAYNNYRLEGIIDCYFFEGEKLILIDFKTDRYRDAEKHRRQMEIYAEALEKSYHRRVDEIHIVWLRYGRSSRIL